ncbi:L,D-transpeptidase family protein [Pedobacter nanyangensis]|uniref:L,D-transpeptidase family protein n=1 Tax=Pedobacter nanyangensis TaxID=1562389 RepID=UPI000DE2530C|nr:L,D-transpeptidase family protein [Pedobacter nanyangensis]
MKLFIAFTLFILMGFSTSAQKGFKQQQLKFERVKAAYDLKWAFLEKELKQAGFDKGYQLYIAAFKAEGKVELWLRAQNQLAFTLFKTYAFCAHSGILGPKIMEGDLQTPEGYYYINVFNPMSNFHLSLGVDYPNEVDKARTGKDRKTGGDIYIHGDCVTVGCIPLTDDKIKEVYLLAMEAKDKGQTQIPVHIFPFRMTKANLEKYGPKYPQNLALWKTLQAGYLYFMQHKTLPKVSQVGGNYVVK